MADQAFGGTALANPFMVPGAQFGAQSSPMGGSSAGPQIGGAPGISPDTLARGQMMQNAVIGDAAIPFKGMQQQQPGQWGGGQLRNPVRPEQGFLGDFQGAFGGPQMGAGELGGMGGLLGMLAQSLNPALSLLSPMDMGAMGFGGGGFGGFPDWDRHHHHHDEDEGE